MCPSPPENDDEIEQGSPSSSLLEPPLKTLGRPTRTMASHAARPTREIQTTKEKVEDGATSNESVSDPREGDADQDGSEDGGRGERKLIARTEDLADRALDRLKSEVAIPNVLEEAEDIARTVGSIRSPALASLVGFYVVSASVGIATTGVARLHDWFMHIAMYVVMLSFLVLYVKSHLMRKRLARSLYALSTTGLFIFFAWVLNDLVGERYVVEEGETILRQAVPLLQVPAVMLLVSAVGLMLHWLLLARNESRR